LPSSNFPSAHFFYRKSDGKKRTKNDRKEKIADKRQKEEMKER
jgi:hypothetical protein